MSDLTALIARLETGSGEDRELDGELMFTAFAKPAGPTSYLWPEDDPSWSFAIRFPGKDRAWFDKCRGTGRETIVIWRDGDPILMNSLRVRPLTSSLDAALAFAEAVLPGWNVTVFSDDAYFAHVADFDDGEWKHVSGFNGAGVAREDWSRSLLSATLRALQAKETQRT